MIENVVVGNKYRNIKTGNIYTVIAIALNSEDPSQVLVIYHKLLLPEYWARPLELFKQKFEEVK